MIASRMNRDTDSAFLAGVSMPTAFGLLGSFCIYRCLASERCDSSADVAKSRPSRQRRAKRRPRQARGHQ